MNLNFYFPTNIQTGSINTDILFKKIYKNGSLPIFISSNEENKNRLDYNFLKDKIKNYNFISYNYLSKEPDFLDLDNIARYSYLSNCNLIVTFGGIYSLNIAKIISIIMGYRCLVNDLYIDKITFNKPQNSKKHIPIFFIPTGILAGLEYNSSIFLFNKEFGYKILNYHPNHLVKSIFIDTSIYTNDLQNFKLLVLSILALNIDSLLSENKNDLTSKFCIQSIIIILECIDHIIKNDKSIENIKKKIVLANHLLGLSYRNTQPGIFYALASGLHFCTKLNIFQSIYIILPYLLSYFLNYDSENDYTNILTSFQNKKINNSQQLLDFIENIYKKFEIPIKLSNYDVKKENISTICEQIYESCFFKKSNIKLTKKELEAILLMSY